MYAQGPLLFLSPLQMLAEERHMAERCSLCTFYHHCCALLRDSNSHTMIMQQQKVTLEFRSSSLICTESLLGHKCHSKYCLILLLERGFSRLI